MAFQQSLFERLLRKTARLKKHFCLAGINGRLNRTSNPSGTEQLARTALTLDAFGIQRLHDRLISLVQM